MNKDKWLVRNKKLRLMVTEDGVYFIQEGTWGKNIWLDQLPAIELANAILENEKEPAQ